MLRRSGLPLPDLKSLTEGDKTGGGDHRALEVGSKGDHDEGFEKEEVREVDDKNMFEICQFGVELQHW